MKILITGASGFIGSHLRERLLKEGYSVRSFVRNASLLNNLGVNEEYLVGDMTDPQALEAAVINIDVVLNCAAKVSDWGNIDEFQKVNVQGTADLFDAAGRAGVKQFVHISSSDVYGFPDKSVGEYAPLKPCRTAYTDTKIEAEKRLLEIQCPQSPALTILRPSNVIGPGSKTYCIEILEAAYELRFIPDLSRRSASAGFVVVDNLVEAIRLTIDNHVAFGKIYNVSEDSPIRWTEYLIRLTDMVGLKSPVIRLPRRAVYLVAAILETTAELRKKPTRPPLTRLSTLILGTHQGFDTSLIRRELGYKPRVDFEEAMQSIHEWLYSNGKFPACSRPSAQLKKDANDNRSVQSNRSLSTGELV